ncbi:DinB family protein [Thermoflexus sp.]|uniref:DinB family protein n=1 Tax=Thermoflexus sp. TaxID=1969742 RepID=UPI00175421DB|nr:DinB family protein [Thermoflexus sp.]
MKELLDRLESTLSDLRWAVAQVPPDREGRRPPPALGDWSVRRQLYHLWFYEAHIALPQIRYVLGLRGPLAPGEVPDEDLFWPRDLPAATWLARLEEVRRETMALVRPIPPEVWSRPVPGTVWGTQTLTWIVTKTVQHTYEHMTTILQIALFWEMAAAFEPRWEFE